MVEIWFTWNYEWNKKRCFYENQATRLLTCKRVVALICKILKWLNESGCQEKQQRQQSQVKHGNLNQSFTMEDTSFSREYLDRVSTRVIFTSHDSNLWIGHSLDYKSSASCGKDLAAWESDLWVRISLKLLWYRLETYWPIFSINWSDKQKEKTENQITFGIITFEKSRLKNLFICLVIGINMILEELAAN